MHSSSGVSTKISMNSVGWISSRTICRSARNGEMKEQRTISPASVISLATSPTRRMFSTRSASVNPRSRLSPCRTLSPSSSIVCRPLTSSLFSARSAIVDFPAPDNPVNHSTAACCSFNAARSLRPTVRLCQCRLLARRRPKAIIPAPAVWLVKRSIRMKAPVSRLISNGSKATGTAVERLQNPISFSSKVRSARCASVSMSMRCFRAVTVAGTVRVPIFNR